MGLEKSLSWFACTLCVRRISGTGEVTVMVCMYLMCGYFTVHVNFLVL